jgi:hypothetical protein
VPTQPIEDQPLSESAKGLTVRGILILQVGLRVQVPRACDDVRLKAPDVSELDPGTRRGVGYEAQADVAAVEKQTDAAMERIISSTQRIFGTTLQLVLYDGSASGLEEGVQETLGVLSRAHGSGATVKPTC